MGIEQVGVGAASMGQRRVAVFFRAHRSEQLAIDAVSALAIVETCP